MIGNCEVPDSLIENNEAFFETLDKDGVVQIGATVYRYDYCSDKVFVISEADASNLEYYTDFLNGMERYNIVGAFPTYVDAIEAVAEGYKTMPDTNTVKGNEVFERSGLFGTVAKENFFIHNDPENAQAVQKMDGKIAYDKFGIYFHFYGKEKYQEPCFFNWCTSSNGLRDWNVYYQYRCRRKGKSYDYMGSGTVYPPG